MDIRNSNRSGFTMIELLMVILLVAVLGSVALPQFLDFRREARISAATFRMTIMRSALVNMKAQMVLRCGATGAAWPSIATLNLNNVVSSGDCTSTMVTSPADRIMIDVPISSLPQILGEVGIQASAIPYVCNYSLKPTHGNLTLYSPGNVNGTSMWCYDNAGNFWAESTTYPEIAIY